MSGLNLEAGFKRTADRINTEWLGGSDAQVSTDFADTCFGNCNQTKV